MGNYNTDVMPLLIGVCWDRFTNVDYDFVEARMNYCENLIISSLHCNSC